MKVHAPSTCAGTLAAALALLLLPAAARAQAPPPEVDPEEALRLEKAHIESVATHGHSHASGGRPELGPVVLGNPTQAVTILRVGLSYSFTASGAFSEFTSVDHPLARISALFGAVHVIDRSNGHQIGVLQPGGVYTVEPALLPDGTFGGYVVSADDVVLGTFAGPVFFRPTQAGELLRLESIQRTNILGTAPFPPCHAGGARVVPCYRGALEIARGSATAANRLNVVNVVEVEDYVPGVVANESIASFHMEALKAQAIAARGYAIANLHRFSATRPYGINDSSGSQVYRGFASEHARAVQASAETVGLVGSYQGRIITALYSSSMGGHTENNEWIFNSPSNQLPGPNVDPVLRGVYDGAGATPDFSDPAVFAAFWKSQQPQTYDSCFQVNNRFSRWRIVIPAVGPSGFPGRGIKGRLPGRYVVVSGDPATVLNGDITDVQVVTQMAGSRRAGVVRVTLTTGVVDVRGWDPLRFVFGRTAASTPLNCGTAAAIDFTLTNPTIIEPVWNPDGTVKEVVAWGGGWGHNVGMSQYGAHGRGREGQTFLQILNAYYTNVDVGSYPIDIGRQPGSGPPTLRQEFVAPAARGRLDVRASGLKGLVVHVNELWDIHLTEEDLAAEVVSVDLSPWLSAGTNLVQYNPVGRHGSASVVVVVD